MRKIYKVHRSTYRKMWKITMKKYEQTISKCPNAKTRMKWQ